MFKLFPPLVLLAISIQAAPIIGPIPITGRGSYGRDFADVWQSVRASGSNSNGSVFFSFNAGCGPVQPSPFFGVFSNLLCVNGDATINGITSRDFDVYLIPGSAQRLPTALEGQGILNLYDSQGNLLISAQLQGYYTNITRVFDRGPAASAFSFSGTFDIVPDTPLPEPSCLAFVGTTLSLLLVARKFSVK